MVLVMNREINLEGINRLFLSTVEQMEGEVDKLMMERLKASLADSLCYDDRKFVLNLQFSYDFLLRRKCSVHDRLHCLMPCRRSEFMYREILLRVNEERRKMECQIEIRSQSVNIFFSVFVNSYSLSLSVK